MTVKKMTEEQLAEAIENEDRENMIDTEEPGRWDDRVLYDGNIAEKIANNDLPEGVSLSEQVSVSILMTPVGPRLFLSGTVADPDRASFLLDAGHKISLDNSVEFYLGLDEDEDEDDDEEFIMTREDFLEGFGEQTPEALEKAADEAGHMVVKDGYVGGGTMTAGDIV